MFLKAYYPLEYMVATLNNGGGFYRKELYIHEARMHGATIKPPCVNYSTALSVIKHKTIYLGLHMISELETETIQRIYVERKTHGLFKDMYDFVNRVPISIEQMRLLIRAGCFNFSKRSKKELLWEIHAILQPISKRKQHEELFKTEVPEWKLPSLTHSSIEEAFDEIALFGFSLCSPFTLLRDAMPSDMRARKLKHHINQEVCIVGYMIHVKYTRTFKGERMYFGTFIDLDGEWIDTVHFPPSAKAFPFTGPGSYEIRGKVMEEYDFICIDANYLKRLAVVDRES
jgi:DNA polymerase-3 subunit alpha